ncbi:hypothetical protein LJB71_07640 [Thermomonas sp. S9]|uniref:hypothetical protein n=1 Tax=Thermomonas sp. S9 TaxID=2885203 RepID=UPI00216AF418|nr:hypothetical protein [Thermomonas sp. S9]MCR6496097.1 hypothetical protein [Thermomonas sp. S9]
MNDPAAPQPVDENHPIAGRRAKLAALRAQGVAFPNDFKRRQAQRRDLLFSAAIPAKAGIQRP